MMCFDMYEKRSVGGTLHFGLNIPPNRKGNSPRKMLPVTVLEGLFTGVKRNFTSVNVLSGGQWTAVFLAWRLKTSFELIWRRWPESVIENQLHRYNQIGLAIKEAIDTHSERVEKHALDTWRGQCLEGKLPRAPILDINRELFKIPRSFTTQKIAD